MDPETVITQVTREEAYVNEHPENGQLPATRLRKPRGGLFRSLLCCIGRGHESRSPSPSPAPEEPAIVPPAPQSAAGTQPPSDHLLPPVRHQDMGRVCLVVDLDETLVHSSFKPIPNADFVVPVEIDGTVHQVYVLKRPHVDDFLQKIGQMFECVLFTASLAKYADPVADLLDQWGVFRSRLFRESCVFYRGNYVKDLERLGRDLRRVAIVDNSPASYIFHPENAVAVTSWFDDLADAELRDRMPLFEALSRTNDVLGVLTRERRQQGLAAGTPSPEPPS